MVETDDFLQNCSVLKSMICKPGGCCLFDVETRLFRLMFDCRSVFPDEEFQDPGCYGWRSIDGPKIDCCRML